MASATGYESFKGSDPEGSPPSAHETAGSSLGALIREREACQGSPRWCLEFCQAYDSATLNFVAQEVAEVAAGGSVACVCAPGVFVALREMAPELSVHLLDFNPAFQDMDAAAFTLYDYTSPTVLPDQLRHRFEVVVADTPYPTEVCALDILQTMQLLVRSVSHPKHYLMTEAELRSAVWEDLGMRPTKFVPRRKTAPFTKCMLYTNCKPSQCLLAWERDH